MPSGGDAFVGVTKAVLPLHYIVGNDFCDLNWLIFGHEVIFCILLRFEDDAFTENALRGSI